MSKFKAIKMMAEMLTWASVSSPLSSFYLNVVFYVQHVHKSCPFSLLKSMAFNSIGNKVVLTFITQRFLPGHKFFTSSLPSSHNIYLVGGIQFITWKTSRKTALIFLIIKIIAFSLISFRPGLIAFYPESCGSIYSLVASEFKAIFKCSVFAREHAVSFKTTGFSQPQNILYQARMPRKSPDMSHYSLLWMVKALAMWSLSYVPSTLLIPLS